MKTIRNGIFETNSSSTHSLTVCSEEEYKGWKEGKFLYSNFIGFVPLEQVLQLIKEEQEVEITNEEALEILKKFPKEYPRFYDYEDHNYYCERDLNTYTTKAGETIYIICEYGYNY